jgi:hypothetical protein
MIKKYSIDILKPNWPKWKINLVDFLLVNFTGLHIGTLNKYILRNNHLKNVPFMRAINKELGVEVEVINGEHIPGSGPLTFVSNHPGGADVMSTIEAVGTQREDMSILANSLVCVEPVIDIVIPVNKLSKTSIKVDLNEIDEAYKKGRAMVFYAAGMNSRYDKSGQLIDRRWRNTFMNYSLKYQSKIVVMHISGRNTNLFYKVARFRERFAALKYVPLENIFQIREFIKARGKIKIIFSNPIEIESLMKYTNNGNPSDIRKLTDKLHDFCYTLSEDNLTFKF